jgi:hypothetical protein
MKGLFLIPMIGGNAVLPEDVAINTALHAYKNDIGLYTVSATAVDLNLLAAQADTVELFRRGVPLEGEEPPPPFDQMPIAGGLRTRFNAWASENMPEIPSIKAGDRGDVFVELVRVMGGHEAEFTFVRTDVLEREV